jgi:hypothetical protein
MTRVFPRGTVVVLLLFMQACSETMAPPVIVPDPCDRVGACEVAGVDLVIDEMALAFASTHPTDISGTHYVQEYDSVPVRYRIRNRGDQKSAAGNVGISSCRECVGSHGRTVLLRALEPGEVDAGMVYVSPATSGYTQTVRPVLNLDAGGGLDEPFYRNNERTTADPYMVVVPTFAGELMVSTPELRFGKPLKFTVTIRNSSEYAILRDTTVSFCFRRVEFYGPDGCYSPFNKLSVPRLAPGAVWTATVDLTVAHDMSRYPKHAAVRVRLDACLGGRTSYVTEPCAAGTELTLLPDVESACTVTVIPFGVTQRGDFTQSCKFGGHFMVWSFEGKAGSTYIASASPTPDGYYLPVGIWDPDGNLVGQSEDRAARATIPKDGRYYLVIRSGAVSDQLAFEAILNESPP